MSGQHNRFENLQSDEERSVEESLMGSDTADILESEDEAKVRVPGAGGDEDIFAKDDQGVTGASSPSSSLGSTNPVADALGLPPFTFSYPPFRMTSSENVLGL